MRFQVGFFSKWWEFARPRPGGLKLIDTNDWNTTTRWGGYNGTKDLRVHSVKIIPAVVVVVPGAIACVLLTTCFPPS